MNISFDTRKYLRLLLLLLLLGFLLSAAALLSSPHSTDGA
jgi:hypothetical protein